MIGRWLVSGEVKALAPAAGESCLLTAFRNMVSAQHGDIPVQPHNLVKGFPGPQAKLSAKVAACLSFSWKMSQGRPRVSCPSQERAALDSGQPWSKVRQWLKCALQALGKVPVPTLALGCRHLLSLFSLSSCHPFASLLPQNASWVL